MKKSCAAVSLFTVLLIDVPPTGYAAASDTTSVIREEFREWIAAYDNKDLEGTIKIFSNDAISTFAGGKDAEKLEQSLQNVYNIVAEFLE